MVKGNLTDYYYGNRLNIFENGKGALKPVYGLTAYIKKSTIDLKLGVFKKGFKDSSSLSSKTAIENKSA